jgi:SnoaL-like domain
MDTAAELRALELLKARYFRLMDTKQWDAWRDLFTDDLVFYMETAPVPTADQPVTVGGNAFVEHVSRALRTATTVHQGHMPELELTGETTARGVWAMFDWVDSVETGRGIQGFGHYHERYRKGADGRWRIAELRLTRLRIDPVPLTDPPAGRVFPPAWSRPQPSRSPGDTDGA